MKEVLFKTMLIIATLALIICAIFMAWLYYAGSCEQIKNFPIPTQVPNRCIKL